MGRVLVALFTALTLGACDPPRECLRSERQTIVTYPNMGLLALGPQYTALAVMPVLQEQDVCLEYKQEPHS